MICGTMPSTFSITALPMRMTDPGQPHPFFAGRVVVIATMHRKEEAIAPLVEAHLGACAFPVALSNSLSPRRIPPPGSCESRVGLSPYGWVNPPGVGNQSWLNPHVSRV